MIRIASLCAILALFTGCKGSSPTTPTATPPTTAYSQIDLVVGTGAPAENGRTVFVAYLLWLYDPTMTDGKGTSIPQSTAPFNFVLGLGNVIKGWDRGVVGMKVGGQRRLIVPPDLAYGSSSPDNGIPANATLVFDIALLAVQ